MPTRESRRQRRKYLRTKTEIQRQVIHTRFPKMYQTFRNDKLIQQSMDEFVKINDQPIDGWLMIS